MKREAEQRKKEKIAEREARKKILHKIEQQKRERAAAARNQVRQEKKLQKIYWREENREWRVISLYYPLPELHVEH